MLGVNLFNEDCRDTITRIPDGSVNLILQDPCYGATKNDWDVRPDLSEMWPMWKRILAPNGILLFTAQQPFATDLIQSNRDWFRYDIVWHKIGGATGFLNSAHMPLRTHELVLVFYPNRGTYNPQKTKGRPAHQRGTGAVNRNNNYGSFDASVQARHDENKHPLSVIEFAPEHSPLHPTQKPVSLMRYLISTYSNKWDLVFDGYGGSCTTAEAAYLEDRHTIVSEKEKRFFQMGVDRMDNTKAMPQLKF